MNILNQLLNFFITSANAQSVAPAGGPPPGNGISLVLMLGFFLVFIYFAVWRPQSKRAKETRDMLSALAKGDEVVTIGGVLGKISKITDNYIVLAISDTVEVNVQRSAIASPLPKGTIKSI